MADNKSPANTLVCESQEALYKKAVKKMNADKLIVQFTFKIENYLTAAAMFEEVGAYSDAEKLAQKCRELAELTREEERLAIYEKALEKKEAAGTIGELEKIEEMLGKLGDFKNAREERKECREKLERAQRKHRRNRNIGMVVLAACLCLIGYGIRVDFFTYAKGMFYEFVGFDEKAELAFEQMGTFLDSEKRLQTCQERLLIQREEDEKKALRKAKAGDTISYGPYAWKVLERNGDQLFLIMAGAVQEGAFYHVSYHNAQEAVRWEDSDLCRSLNSGVLEEVFSQKERARLIEMKDSNLVSILSLEEAERYKSILNALGGLDYWLKTPGNREDKAVFVTAGDTIIDDGYPVTSSDISVRPVIWIDGSETAEEETA